MSEPENFLTRWSRRKAAATEENVAPAETPNAAAHAGEITEAKEQEEKNPEGKLGSTVPPSKSEKPEAAFDLSSLPPIEEIGAATDISVFLRSGVPAELTRAALRRAWAADPNIRDFIGLSENAWDFTAPDGVPGFGPLSADDATRLMAQYSNKAKEIVAQAKQVVENLDKLAPKSEPARSSNESSALPVSRDVADDKSLAAVQDAPEHISSPAPKEASQSDGQNIALQNDRDASDENSQPARRAHGRALPE